MGRFLDCLHGSVARIDSCSRRGRVNRVQKFREAALMAKAELARRAGVSESTVDRIEAGRDCRMETNRKILFALGLTIPESGQLFPPHNRSTRQRAAAQ